LHVGFSPISCQLRSLPLRLALAVYAFAGPVNFTGTGPNDFTYATVAWQASAKKDGETAETRFSFNLKVTRIATVIKDQVVELLGKRKGCLLRRYKRGYSTLATTRARSTGNLGRILS
jgi:hypothetical protein